MNLFDIPIFVLPIVFFGVLWPIICCLSPCYGCYSSLTEKMRKELEDDHGIDDLANPHPNAHDDGYSDYAKKIHRLWEEKTGKKSPIGFWIYLP